MHLVNNISFTGVGDSFGKGNSWLGIIHTTQLKETFLSLK